MSTTLCRLCGVLLLALASGMPARAADDLEVGRALYLEGRRSSGAPLQAHRSGGLVLGGAQAACVNCHRRSGLGGAEGRTYIPPITADILSQALPPGTGPSATGKGRPAYTQATLLRATREGVDPAGRVLDYLMPRYELSAVEVRGLLRYLATPEGLPPEPGASLHFATVVTPGVPDRSRRAMLDVLQACFAEHNAGPGAETGRRKLARSMRVRHPRAWELHVWEVHGPESSWDAQLAAHARDRSVFAIVGGIGASWAPVDAFCEKAKLPCLFPHVDLPVERPGAFYPMYWSKGVLLEAALMAEHFAASPPRGRVIQVVRERDEAAGSAAQALRRSLDRQHVPQKLVVLSGSAAAVAQGSAQDAFVLWLRPPDLERLAAQPPLPAKVFASATLAGQDAVPLSPEWKERTLLAYPFELPELRPGRKGLLTEEERIQSDARLACSALRSGMQDAEAHPGPEYLVEKIEANIERWAMPGLYPRLTLGPGQRFASKTGYVVRIDAASGRLVPLGERSAP